MELMKMDLAQIVNNYKSKIVNIVIILLALVISYKIYMNQNKVADSIRQSKDREAKKNTVLNDINVVGRRINQYKDLVNKKDISTVINTLSNISTSSDVKITSLSPAMERNYTTYIKYPFRIAGVAKDYNVIGKFINELENSPEVFIIESIVIKPGTGQEQDYPEGLTLDLTLYTVLFK